LVYAMELPSSVFLPCLQATEDVKDVQHANPVIKFGLEMYEILCNPRVWPRIGLPPPHIPILSSRLGRPNNTMLSSSSSLQCSSC
jgi:hypothetical protein